MPRTGLNIPIVTALDETGKIIESDQRRIINHTIQNGRGADSLFICGTTGEFNRITNKQRQKLLEIGIDETRRANSFLPEGSVPVETWAGVTSETKAETIENLRLAVELGADMAIIDPLAITELEPGKVIEFFERDVAEVLGSNELFSIGLYENPDIVTAPGNLKLLPQSSIDALRRLPFISGLKASTTREVLQAYMNAFATDDKADSFPLYFGNAGVIFEMDEMLREAGTGAQKPAGVVSGTANLLPAEWQQAWKAILAHNTEEMNLFRDLFIEFEKLTVFENGQGSESKLIAGIKHGMFSLGIISSPCVAPGTPALTRNEQKHLTDGLSSVLSTFRDKFARQRLSIYEPANSEVLAI